MARMLAATSGILLLGSLFAPAWPGSQQPARTTHRVIEENRSGIVVEVRFPAPSVLTETGPAGSWSRFRVAGAPDAWRRGEPVLPEYALPLAVPVGARARLRITGLQEHALPLATPPGIVEIDPGSGAVVGIPLSEERDGRSDFSAPARVERLGTARQTQLARLTVHPVYFDRDREAWICVEWIRARVDFVGEPSVGEPEPERVDSMNRSLDALVANPSAVALARTVAAQPSSVETATIPEPEPSTFLPLKILIRENGLYRVTHADLLGAGIDPDGVAPATFVLTNRGEEVAIEVEDGGDGSFDPGDEFRFYGQALGGEESWDNVYRLTGGVRDGLRVAARDATPDGFDPSPVDFTRTVHLETDFLYFASVPEEAPSPWFWDSLAVGLAGTPVFVDHPVVLNSLSAEPSPGRLEVHVQSRRETPGVSPNHHVRIYLNGNLVDDQTWTGLLGVTLSGEVPRSWLLEGINIVRIENPSDLGLTTQTEYSDWIRVEYDRQFVAEDGYLAFGAPSSGPWEFHVEGFSGPEILVYDVNEPQLPVRLTGVVTEPPSCTTCTAVFRDAVDSPPGSLVALNPHAAKAPWGFEPDEPSDLRGLAATGADMLIVAYRDFLGALAPLVSLRESQGLRVVAADLENVYDEFNGGIAEVQGIKNFVSWAFDHYAPPAPSYLLLVGDATFDPKDNKGLGDNYVPAKFIYATGFGYVPSESWYGAVNGDDDLPDLAVGRISARGATGVEAYVANLLAYEDFPPVAAVNSGLLYVTDDDDAQFEAVSENLIALFHPPAMAARRVYLADYPQTVAGVDLATAEIGNALNAGSLVTTYFGHGGRTTWAQEELWGLGDVSALQASGNLSFVLALNCVNAFFTNTDAEPFALGEWWNLVADRGAVANLSPSALGTLFNYQVISARLFQQIFEYKQTRLGLASWSALLHSFLLDNIDLLNVKDMILFGDPAAVLPLDSDRDGFLDLEELDAGSDPDDADTDDDGLLDNEEPSWNTDIDQDGAVNAADYDADDDGLPDGLESGVTDPDPATDTSAGHFVADSDPSSVTDPTHGDSDGGGAPDGAEDRNVNGRVDPDETDPRNPADDPTCRALEAGEVENLMLSRDAQIVALLWDDQAGQDPCVLYRVYAAKGSAAPDTFEVFGYLGTSTQPTMTIPGIAADGESWFFLVTATSPLLGEGPLGHYGR